MRLALLALFWRFETPPQLSPLPVMRNINRPANSFTVTGDAEYKHAGNKVSLALCPLSRGLIFFCWQAVCAASAGYVSDLREISGTVFSQRTSCAHWGSGYCAIDRAVGESGGWDDPRWGAVYQIPTGRFAY